MQQTSLSTVYGTIAHSIMPPHDIGGFNSISKSTSLGVSFSAHQRATVRIGSDRTQNLCIDAGSAFVVASSHIDWLRVRERSEALEIAFDMQALHGAADSAGIRRNLEIRDVFASRDVGIWSRCALLRVLIASPHQPMLRVEELLVDLSLRVVCRYGNAPLNRYKLGKLNDVRLDRLVAYVNEKLSNRIRLADLAAVVFMSPFHFSRVFKSSTGMSPSQLVTFLRMQRARELLRRRKMTVRAIASTVGYSSLPHFREKFRQAFGHLPRVRET